MTLMMILQMLMTSYVRMVMLALSTMFVMRTRMMMKMKSSVAWLVMRTRVCVMERNYVADHDDKSENDVEDADAF